MTDFEKKLKSSHNKKINYKPDPERLIREMGLVDKMCEKPFEESAPDRNPVDKIFNFPQRPVRSSPWKLILRFILTFVIIFLLMALLAIIARKNHIISYP